MIPLGRYLLTLRRVLVPNGSITEQAVKSGIWATLLNVGDRGLQLGKLVILANLLAPADFGLMGIALLTLAVFTRFSNLGLNAALIQREEIDIDHHLNTAWVMKLGRGLVIAGIAFLVAPYAANFFGEPHATDIIRVIAVSPILLGMQNPGVVYLKKDLEFHKQFVYQLSSSLVSVGVAVGFALVYQNVWALVFGFLAGDVVKVIASYLIHEYRPWFEFELETAKELYGYGKWLTLSGIILFLITQGDDAFVGWYLGATALGFYQMAYRFSNAPATEISHVLSSVLFPTYSKLQQSTQRLREAYFSALQLVLLLIFPMAVGIFVIAPTFVRTFFGSEWIPMIVPMQVLVIFGLIRAIMAAGGTIFDAVGRPDYTTKISSLNLTLIAIFIYPATELWGITGTAMVLVGEGLISLWINIYLVMRIVEGSYPLLLRYSGFPAIASALMGGIVYLLQERIFNTPAVLSVTSLIAIGILVYVCLIAIIEYQFEYGVRNQFRTIIDSLG